MRNASARGKDDGGVRERRDAAESIALLPVEATVNRARVIETEGLVDEGLVYGEMFNSQVEAFLAAKGYEVQIIDPERINSDPQLQEYFVDANRGFDDMMSKYRPKKLREPDLQRGRLGASARRPPRRRRDRLLDA